MAIQQVTTSGIDDAEEQKRLEKEKERFAKATSGIAKATGDTIKPPAPKSGGGGQFMSNLIKGAGIAGGPAGAAAAVGLGVLQSAAAAKQRKRKAKRESLMKQGDIAQKQGQDEANILQNLMASLRGTIIR